jgi:hypothetical protein
MTVSPTAGTRMYIGPVIDVDAINAHELAGDDASAMAVFEAIVDNDWTEITEIESFGDLGDNTEVTTFTAVNNRRARKFKTTRDAGTMSIVCGVDPLDEGQVAMIAAEKDDDDYAFKVVYNDARADAYSPSTDYFGGMVLSRPKNIGGVTDITKRTFSIAVNTAVYEDATDPTGS